MTQYSSNLRIWKLDFKLSKYSYRILLRVIDFWCQCRDKFFQLISLLVEYTCSNNAVITMVLFPCELWRIFDNWYFYLIDEDNCFKLLSANSDYYAIKNELESGEKLIYAIEVVDTIFDSNHFFSSESILLAWAP